MLTFCETYLCNQPAQYFIGPKDGPLMLKMNLCKDCKQSVLDGLIKEDEEYVLERVKQIKEETSIAGAKERYGGKEFPCDKCGEIFYSPPMLASHVKKAHKAGEVEEKSTAQ